MTLKDENIETNGYVLGVLQSAEFYLKAGKDLDTVQGLINELLDGKMKYIRIKRMARKHGIGIDWNLMDITVKRTD